MSTRIFLWVRRGDDLTTFMYRVSRKLGALTSWTPVGHEGLEQGYFINVENWWKCANRGKLKYLWKTCPCATASTWSRMESVANKLVLGEVSS
jgi:hypothetical protein